MSEQDIIFKIINSDHSHIRVLAGPGTGKTYQMMQRIARLLKQNIEPQKIFAVTFTRTAANDLIKRLKNLQVNGCEKVRTSTLHSFCFYILNKQEILNLTERVPRPLLQFEEKFLLYDLPNKFGFGGFNDRRKRLRAFEAAWARLLGEQAGWPNNTVDQNFQNELLRWLKFHQAMLVGELVPTALNYLRNNPECPERNLFEYVLVDEFQDLNQADQRLIEFISEHAKLFITGDDNQSIYSFRYAHPDAIKEIPEGAEFLTLQECQRLPRRVVKMANTIFLSHPLIALSQNPEGEIYNLQWRSMEEEAEGVAKVINHYIKKKNVLVGEILVLAPNRVIGYTIRDALKNLEVPVRSYFQEDALDSNEAQEAWTLLTLLTNPNDRVSLRSWLSLGSQSLRKTSYQKIWLYCEQTDESPWNILEKLANKEIKISGAKEILNRFQDLKTRLEDLKPLSIRATVDKLFLENNKEVEQLRILALELLKTVDSISKLKEEMQIRITQPELPTDCDFVRVMSLYKAKGLTANFVIIAGCVDAFIPRVSRNNSLIDQATQLDEQKRLFYVALTRTRNYLFISSFRELPSNKASKMGARFRYRGRKTGVTFASRFIQELKSTVPSSISGEKFLQNLGRS